MNKYPHLHGLKLADYSDYQDSIGVLIGSDYYWHFFTGEIVRGDFGPTAINSNFGWILPGPTETAIDSGRSLTNLTISGNSTCLFDDTQDTLVDNLKSSGKQSQLESGENQTSNSRTIVLTKMYVELPWKENHRAISSDYELCLSHLKCLQPKMLKEPEVIHEYNQIIEEQVNRGIMKEVATEENKKTKECITFPTTP